MGNGTALGWSLRLHRRIQKGSNPLFSTKEGGQIRKIFLITCFTFLFLFASSIGTARSTATCSITPNPVIAGQRYKVELFGGSPNTWYWSWVSQPKNNGITQQHAAGAFQTDATGYGYSDLDSLDPTHYLQPGELNAKVTTYGGGAKIAACSGTVVAA